MSRCLWYFHPGFLPSQPFENGPGGGRKESTLSWGSNGLQSVRTPRPSDVQGLSIRNVTKIGVHLRGGDEWVDDDGTQ